MLAADQYARDLLALHTGREHATQTHWAVSLI